MIRPSDVPASLSRSTFPAMPATWPSLVCCHTTQPLPVPVRRGEGGRRDAPVRDPERCAVPRDEPGVPGAGHPAVRARVDEGRDAGERAHLGDPRARPSRDALLVQALGSSRCRAPEAGTRLRIGDLHEVACLAARVAGRGVGSGEVVRAHEEAVRPGLRAVRREGGVDVVDVVGRLHEGELLAGAGDLGPVDRALPVRDVDAGDRGSRPAWTRDAFRGEGRLARNAEGALAVGRGGKGVPCAAQGSRRRARARRRSGGG